MEDLREQRRRFSLLLAGSLAVSLFCLLYPVYVIRPFRAQGVRELTAALFVIRFRPLIMGASVVFAMAAAIGYWRLQPRRWGRAGAALGASAVCACAVLSLVNIYELLFHPLGAPAFVPAADSRLDRDEKVIALQVNGVSRAYPIRGLSYHHIVNDVVGGVPVAATY